MIQILFSFIYTSSMSCPDNYIFWYVLSMDTCTISYLCCHPAFKDLTCHHVRMSCFCPCLHASCQHTCHATLSRSSSEEVGLIRINIWRHESFSKVISVNIHMLFVFNRQRKDVLFFPKCESRKLQVNPSTKC